MALGPIKDVTAQMNTLSSIPECQAFTLQFLGHGRPWGYWAGGRWVDGSWGAAV